MTSTDQASPARPKAPGQERPLPHLYRVRRYFRDAIWVVPAAWLAIAMYLSTVLPDVDRTTHDLTSFPITADSARTVLASIATGMITFTGFVFSMVLLVVQFGSQGFSPRYVQYVRHDRVIQHALGAFIATALYSLVAIGEVGSVDVDVNDVEYVPALTVVFAFVLTFASLVLFLALILRVIRNFQVAGAVRVVGKRGTRAIKDVYPLPLDPDDPAVRTAAEPPAVPDPAEPGTFVVPHRGAPAFVVAVDRRRLVSIGRRTGGCVYLGAPIGAHVSEGAPLVTVAGARRPPSERWLRRAIVLGPERSIEQDPGFAMRILVDVAIKALSPAVNDPTTAVQVLNVLDDQLRRLAWRRIEVGELTDDDAVVRVVVPTPTWDDYVDLALTEIREYGRASVQVARRMRALLEDLLAALPEVRRPAIREHLELLDAAVRREFDDDATFAIAMRRDPMGIGGEG